MLPAVQALFRFYFVMTLRKLPRLIIQRKCWLSLRLLLKNATLKMYGLSMATGNTYLLMTRNLTRRFRCLDSCSFRTEYKVLKSCVACSNPMAAQWWAVGHQKTIQIYLGM